MIHSLRAISPKEWTIYYINVILCLEHVAEFQDIIVPIDIYGFNFTLPVWDVAMRIIGHLVEFLLEVLILNLAVSTLSIYSKYKIAYNPF